MDFVQHFLPSIAHLGILGYWVAFAVAFLESMAIVGSLIPGAIIVVIFGFFSAQGYWDLGDLIWFVSIGAILGDSVSYYLGGKGIHFFKNENLLLRASHLEKGKIFFEKHGNKSIFLGRFIGPLRSIVPFIAGLSRMNMRSFLILNVVSGFLWAVTHLLIGYFFGGTLSTLGVWTGRVGLFIAGLVIAVFFFWYVIKRSRPFWHFLKSLTLSIAEAIAANSYVRHFAKKHSSIVRFVKARLKRGDFRGLPLTVLCIAFIYILLSFGGLIQDIISSDPIVSLGANIANLLYVFRDTELILFFLWVTVLGKWQVVAIFAGIASILFWLWKKRVYIYSMWITLVGTAAFVYLGKILINRQRPGEYLPFYHEASLSFPSGHAAISVALYGFLTYALWKQLRFTKTKTTILFIGVSIIFFIGLSRMYLGVHFLSDVLGGYLVGALWLIVGIVVTEWHFTRKKTVTVQRKKMAKILTPFLIGGGLVFYVMFGLAYHPIQNTYKPVYIVKNASTVTTDLFKTDKGLPKFTEGLTGGHQEPIGFVFLAKNDSALTDAFQKAGWSRADIITIATLGTLVKSALLKTPYETAPITPSFWNQKAHDFGFEKPTDADTIFERHHVRVWKTNVKTSEGKFVYVATASFDIGLKWFVTHKISPDIDSEKELLFADLEKAGLVGSYKKETLVKPMIGRNFAGDPFFTDGEIYFLNLK